MANDFIYPILAKFLSEQDKEMAAYLSQKSNTNVESNHIRWLKGSKYLYLGFTIQYYSLKSNAKVEENDRSNHWRWEGLKQDKYSRTKYSRAFHASRSSNFLLKDAFDNIAILSRDSEPKKILLIGLGSNML